MKLRSERERERERGERGRERRERERERIHCVIRGSISDDTYTVINDLS